MKTEFLVSQESELDEVASELLRFSGDSRIFAFFGSMGAGKTTFIRRICNLLHVTENVSSPTFSIVNEYDSPEGKIFHFDFYRIAEPAEAIDIGCLEYFDSGNLCLIEWPEKILNLLPQHFIKISIEVNGLNRRISFSHD